MRKRILKKILISKYFFLPISFLIIGSIFFIIKKQETPSLFYEIPMKSFKHNSFYYVDIEIESKKRPILIDTGSSMGLNLHKEVLDEIQNKKVIGHTNWFDINGNKYKSPRYLLDLIKIENLKATNVTAEEESPHFLAHGSMIINPNKEHQGDSTNNFPTEQLNKEVGNFGAGALRKHKYWLLDFPNSKMYFIEKLDETLKKFKISLEDFIEIPLQPNSSHIVIAIDTDFGIKSFVLDSAAELTVMRCPSKNYSPHQTLTSEKFIVGNHNLGKKKIYLFDFTTAFKFDGFLGIDFLKKRAILLDFKKNRIFLGPETSNL